MPRASTATAVRRKIDLIGRAATSDYHATGPAPAAPGRQEDQPSPTSRKLAGLAASQWRRLPLPQQHRTREQHRIHVTHEEGATSYPYNTRGASSPGGHRDNIAHGQVHAAVNNVDLPEKPVDRLTPPSCILHSQKCPHVDICHGPYLQLYCELSTLGVALVPPGHGDREPLIYAVRMWVLRRM